MTNTATHRAPVTLGPHQLYRGDVLDVLRALEDNTADLLLADPPYCSGGLTGTERKASTSSKYQQSGAAARYEDFPGDQRDERSFVLWSALWLTEAYRILRPGSSALVFSDWRQLANTADAVQVAGMVFRGIVPWHKNGARPQPNSFRADCEYLVWATKGDIDRRPLPSAKYLPGLYSYSSPRDREHMNQKPVQLLRDLMKIAPAGGRVLDPFMGSGTTGVAAVESGLAFTGVEVSPHYFRVSSRRIEDAVAAAQG